MDSKAIKYIENHHTSFSGLQFSRALKLQTLQQAKQVFNAANLSIANRSLKCKKEVKELILWARRVRKQDIDVCIKELFIQLTAVLIYLYAVF